ncbi:unnamed protein product [Prunus armeniaca]
MAKGLGMLQLERLADMQVQSNCIMEVQLSLGLMHSKTACPFRKSPNFGDQLAIGAPATSLYITYIVCPLRQPIPFTAAKRKSLIHKLATLLRIRPLSSSMPPKKKTRSNNMTSQDRSSHGDLKSRQNATSREEERASEGAFTLSDLVAAIHAMGETQMEMANTIKKLKSSVAKRSKENERLLQESVAAGNRSKQKGPTFVTQEDVIAMLEKELSQSQEDWKYLPQPPYLSSLLQQPYPKGYEAPNFILFDRRKGSLKEHVNHFINALGLHAGDYSLRLREFSKSLTDRAYT